ncbi:MAG: 4Fe-4S binding protein [Synergistaceae bacterium]|jgi:NAD-dependent dihydropyrimidine dehydrogenase PreA subunit|nr:4Fe-4S binding protein [Synergistaceae bacterium]
MKTSYIVDLDPEGCKGCGYCRIVCPRGVCEPSPDLNAKGYRIYRANAPEKCVGCMKCVFVCPDFCLDVLPAFGADADAKGAIA